VNLLKGETMDFDKTIEFEAMKDGCPWILKKHVNIQIFETCAATGAECSDDGCALFHWMNNLRDRIHVSVMLD
jgi:hypothetical protein